MKILNEVFLSKIIKLKLYDKISNINHYYTYIVELLSGIIYFLLKIFKPDIQTGITLYSITVIACSFILFIKSKKDILFYILFSVVMYSTNFNFFYFNNILTFFLIITLLIGCGVAFLVNFRFNINYKLSVVFICSSIVLTCLIIEFMFSKVHIIYLDNAFYQNALLAVLAADVAIVCLIISINNNSLKSIFDKRAYGASFNLLFEYAKRKSGLIIEDKIIMNKDRYYDIQLVHEAYVIFMNCKMETTIGTVLLILNALTIAIQNLNITILMMIFTISYCLWVSNFFKCVTLDEEKHKKYIINFVSFIYCTSYDMNLLNWMKDDFISFVEENGLKITEKKHLVVILDNAINGIKLNRKSKNRISSIIKQKLNVLEEIRTCVKML